MTEFQMPIPKTREVHKLATADAIVALFAKIDRAAVSAIPRL